MASDKPKDGFFTKVVVATVVVIWMSLVGGNWLGHYAIDQGYLGKEEEAVEFRDMPSPAPRPWVKVDPKLQEELEQHRRQTTAEEEPPTPTPTATVTATPLAQPEEAAAPVAQEKAEEPREPTPTPEMASDGDYRLQFGAFGDQTNAKRLADELTEKGQSAVVEEIDTADGKVYRVRGEVFQEAGDAKVAAEGLKEQGIQVFVVSQ